MNTKPMSVQFAEALTEKFKTESEFTMKRFSVQYGRKYDRIVQEVPEHSNGASVHAFVEKETGDLYKAAGWKSPAKGVRYNGAELLTLAVENADVHGRYLYAR